MRTLRGSKSHSKEKKQREKRKRSFIKTKKKEANRSKISFWSQNKLVLFRLPLNHQEPDASEALTREPHSKAKKRHRDPQELQKQEDNPIKRVQKQVPGTLIQALQSSQKNGSPHHLNRNPDPQTPPKWNRLQPLYTLSVCFSPPTPPTNKLKASHPSISSITPLVRIHYFLLLLPSPIIAPGRAPTPPTPLRPPPSFPFNSQ